MDQNELKAVTKEPTAIFSLSSMRKYISRKGKQWGGFKCSDAPVTTKSMRITIL